MVRFIRMLALVVVASCGRGIKDDALLTSASTSPSTISAVLSGRSGDPVTSAHVAATSQFVRIEAPGFLKLQSTRGGSLYLWPLDERLPRELTVSLTHGDGMTIRFGMYVRRVSLLLPDEMKQPDVVERVRSALRVINDAQQSIHYVVDDYSSDMSVRLYFDSRDEAFQKKTETFEQVVAVAHVLHTSEGVIQLASITFPSRAYVDFKGWFEAVLVHELGHTMGLGHTPRGVAGMMSASLTNATSGFTDSEKTVLAMLYRRIPGTRLRGDVEYEGYEDLPASGALIASTQLCVR